MAPSNGRELDLPLTSVPSRFWLLVWAGLAALDLLGELVLVAFDFFLLELSDLALDLFLSELAWLVCRTASFCPCFMRDLLEGKVSFSVFVAEVAEIVAV